MLREVVKIMPTMFNNEVDALEKAGELAKKYGTPFAVLLNDGDYTVSAADVIDSKHYEVVAIVLSNGNFQRMGSHVIRNTFDIREFAGQIIDIFEDFLTDKDVSIDNPDRDKDNEPDSAIIYGDDYYELEKRIVDTIKNWTGK